MTKAERLAKHAAASRRGWTDRRRHNPTEDNLWMLPEQTLRDIVYHLGEIQKLLPAKLLEQVRSKYDADAG
jgi:hypothetical protein